MTGRKALACSWVNDILNVQFSVLCKHSLLPDPLCCAVGRAVLCCAAVRASSRTAGPAVGAWRALTRAHTAAAHGRQARQQQQAQARWTSSRRCRRSGGHCATREWRAQPGRQAGSQADTLRTQQLAPAAMTHTTAQAVPSPLLLRLSVCPAAAVVHVSAGRRRQSWLPDTLSRSWMTSAHCR
jgi:hypothetical protein